MPIQLSDRQLKIVDIVKEQGPITGETIAHQLNLTRAALRADLTILVMTGIIDARPKVGYYYTGKTVLSRLAEYMKTLKVQDLKSVPIVVKEETSVYDAIVTMFIEDVGTLFVVGPEGILEGVVSRKDLLKITLGQVDINRTPVKVMMTRMPNVVTTTPDENIIDATRKIIEHQVDALPVVRPKEGDGSAKRLEVVGRLTKTNITKLFLELGAGK